MLNNAENLTEFIKFLAHKATQVIVQSRLGEKIQTECSKHAAGAGENWFNLAVQEHPDIKAETKAALDLGPDNSIQQRLPLCVEISLKTVEEGDQMVLEVWTLDLQPPPQPPPSSSPSPPKDEHTKANDSAGEALKVYNRMSIMLKSLVTLTRATPAYKLSRRQCPDSYGIYYRIYVEQPQMNALGEGHKSVRIGQVLTLFGTLAMSVAYRTKMTITPSSGGPAYLGGGNGIMLKSDHFRRGGDAATPNTNGGQFGAKMAGGAMMMGGANGGGKVVDIDKPLRHGAFAEVSKLKQYTEQDYVLPETPPFEWLLRCADAGSNGSIESLNRRSDSSPVGGRGALENYNNNVNGLHRNNSNNSNNAYPAGGGGGSNNNNNVAAFKNFEKAPKNSASPPASATLLKQSLLIPVAASPPTTTASTPANDDDNLLKELNFPFATPTSHVNDLAKFYRDCYHAPPLRGLDELQASSSPTAALPPVEPPVRIAELGGCGAVAYKSSDAATAANSAVDDLSRQLEEFETSLEDYDELVSQLGLASNTTTSSGSGGGLQMSN